MLDVILKYFENRNFYFRDIDNINTKIPLAFCGKINGVLLSK